MVYKRAEANVSADFFLLLVTEWKLGVNCLEVSENSGKVSAGMF